MGVASPRQFVSKTSVPLTLDKNQLPHAHPGKTLAASPRLTASSRSFAMLSKETRMRSLRVLTNSMYVSVSDGVGMAEKEVE